MVQVSVSDLGRGILVEERIRIGRIIYFVGTSIGVEGKACREDMVV